MIDSAVVTVCAALGDESRWSVLAAVGEAEASASSLAGRLPISRQAITKHLVILDAAGLVESVRDGREVRYRALGSRLTVLARSLEETGTAWDRRLESIKNVAESL